MTPPPQNDHAIFSSYLWNVPVCNHNEMLHPDYPTLPTQHNIYTLWYSSISSRTKCYILTIPPYQHNTTNTHFDIGAFHQGKPRYTICEQVMKEVLISRTLPGMCLLAALLDSVCVVCQVVLFLFCDNTCLCLHFGCHVLVCSGVILSPTLTCSHCLPEWFPPVPSCLLPTVGLLG